MSPQDLQAQIFLGLQLSHRIPTLGSDLPRGTRFGAFLPRRSLRREASTWLPKKR